MHEEGERSDCIAVAVASMMKMIVIAIVDPKIYFQEGSHGLYKGRGCSAGRSDRSD